MKKTIKAFIGSDADEFFHHHKQTEAEREECYDQCYKIPFDELCKRKGGLVDVEKIQRTDPDLIAVAEANGLELMDVEPDREYMVYHDLFEGDLIFYKDEIEWLKS